MNTESSLPLARFVVLDLTRVRAGPSAARMFGDWGANVIKVESPEALGDSVGLVGDRDGSDFQNLHRNKRSIALNLKQSRAREILHRLVAKADVVIENYRPSVKGRLGLDYETLSGINPRVVLASLSGYGQDGPYVDRPAFDQVLQGMGGLMSVTGLPGQGPVRAGIPIADLSSGVFGVIGILTALLEREVSGKGQWVQTSLLEAQIAMMDFQAARYLVDGEVPQTAGNHHPTGIPTGLFRTADGHINLSIDGEGMWQRLCAALGLPELVNDADYATPALRSDNRDRLNARIDEVTCRHSTEQWMKTLMDADIPCGPVYDMQQVFDDPQVHHVNMRHPVQHPRLGEMDLVAQPVRMSRSRRQQGVAAPDNGEHGEEILREFGFTSDEVRDLREAGVI